MSVPEALAVTLYKGCHAVLSHSVGLADFETTRLHAVGGEAWILFAGFHGAAKATTIPSSS